MKLSGRSVNLLNRNSAIMPQRAPNLLTQIPKIVNRIGIRVSKLDYECTAHALS
jgi:hypothetical protein